MKKLLLALSLLCPFAFSQTTIKPDCAITFSFTTTAATSNTTCGNNIQGITTWVLAYSSTGFSAISLVVQSAPDVAGAPGTWSTFAGTVLTTSQFPGSSGINPNTSITSANTGLAGYFPWNRVNLTSVTGTGKVTGTLYGFLNSTLSKAGSGGSGGGALTIAGTANQITVTGAGCTPTNTGTCTLAFAVNAALPGSPTTTTATTGDISTKIATTGFVNGAITNAFTGCTFITGSLTCPGSITSGSGSGVAGTLDLTQGTLPASFPGNSFSLYSPTSIGTGYQWLVPAADSLGFVRSSGAGTPGVLSLVGETGSGNVVRAVAPTIGLVNGTGLPVSTGISGLGTGVATALATAVSGTGGICLSSGSACSGGGGAAGATLFSTTNSTTVTATSPTTLIGTVTGSTTIPVNTFTAGQVLEFAAQGFYSTPVTAASLTIALSIGGTNRITTGAVVQIPSVTTGTWRLRCIVTTRTAGASGSQIANCIFEATGSTLTPGDSPMQTTSTWTIDTTATQVIDLLATWSTAVGAPTITSTNVAAWIPGAPVTSVNGLTGAVTVAGGTPAGSTGQWQANSAGSFAGLVGTSILPQSGWTIVNCGGQCIYNDFSTAEQSFAITANSSLNWRLLTRPLPGATYTIITSLDCRINDLANTNVSNAYNCGLFISDGTKLIVLEMVFAPGVSGFAGTCQLRVDQLTNVTTELGPSKALTPNIIGCNATLKIVNDGTHRTYFYWINTTGTGGYVQFFQENTGTFLTETVYGWGGLAVSSTTFTSSEPHLRYLLATTP